MDKLAAYSRVLATHPLWGPHEYSFNSEFQKEALLQAAGRAVTGGIYQLGRALAGKPGVAGEAGSRVGAGGRLMDWASGLGGTADGGAAAARAARKTTAYAKDGITATPEQISAGRESAQKLLGGAALAGGGATLAGGGYLLGRPSN
jgi:hypothetical protein